MTQTMTDAQARALGRAHGRDVPCTPADYEQARADRTAAHRAFDGASVSALDAYLEGHVAGQEGR